MLLAQTGSGTDPCLSWSYTLVVDQNFPSRMAVVKNVLGNSVTIITPWEAPVPWPAITNPNWLCGGACSVSPAPSLFERAPTAIGQHWTHEYTWTVTYTTPQPDPGPPFNLYDKPATDATRQPLVVGAQLTWPAVYDFPGAQFGSGAQTQAPLDIIGTTSQYVNWGLETFSTQLDYVAGSGTPGSFNAQRRIVALMDTRDTGDVSTIEQAMQLFANGGTNVFGSTPTLAALDFAKTLLQDTAQGTPAGNPLVDDLHNSFTIPRDLKLECGRAYASILVTDGLSNIGNPGGCNTSPGYSWGNWDEPCWSCDCSVAGTGFNGGPGCPDGGDSGYTCPDQYTQFAAGKAEEAWQATVLDASGTTHPLKARTWVIGISKDVGPCELNYTAYRGRSDANAPNGDAGFNTALDPYLPEGTPGNYDGLTASGCGPGVSHDPAHGDYAFFATTAASLGDAIKKIINAFGTGDYSTSGPSVANSATAATSLGLITTASYPGWRGHMYAYDLRNPFICTKNADCPTSGVCNVVSGACNPPDTYHLLWDAGESMSAFKADGTAKTVNNGLPRSLYTWNPSQLGTGNDPLVALTGANAGTLDAICGGCGITAQIVDFAMGNDGSGNPRPWNLGAIINSTPAIMAPPERWRQFSGHDTFESAYAARHDVSWVASSDGMLHAIDLKDGAELFGLIPPDKLDFQVQLYNQYKLNPVDYAMGQLGLPGDHKYGVANSPRFGDVFDGTNYRTLLFIGEGPGGTGVHAIDITHPFVGRTYGDGTTGPPDPNYGYGKATTPPVFPLWSKTQDGKAGTQILNKLAMTWSVPALAGTTNGTNWELIVGNGYVPYSASDATTANPRPYVLRLDPFSGTVRSSDQVTNPANPQTLGGPWVRNQTFADSTMWSTAAGSFQPDNDVNQGVQPDLQGQLWLLNRTSMGATTWNTPSTFPDGSAQIAGSPLYYPAAVASYPADNPQYDIYVFSSGTFYESSQYITGPNVGLDPVGSGPQNFIPSLFIAEKQIGLGTVVKKLDIRDLRFGSDGTQRFGHLTQVTAPPMIFTPRAGAQGTATALFLVYDPQANACIGNAYIVRLDFDPATLATAANPFTVVVADAGQGAASGFAIGGSIPLVAKSWVGADGRAYFDNVYGVPLTPSGGAGGQIAWWVELQ